MYEGQSKSKMALPHFAAGEVVKGFGRGSKQLGIPTANYPPEVVNNLPEGISTGVYYGWAKVEDSPVYKMVMSIGWNPYFKNEKKSMETYIMHEFGEDFYGKQLKVAVVGYIRPEMNFSSLDDLIRTIRDDVAQADELLEKPEFQVIKREFAST